MAARMSATASVSLDRYSVGFMVMLRIADGFFFNYLIGDYYGCDVVCITLALAVESRPVERRRKRKIDYN